MGLIKPMSAGIGVGSDFDDITISGESLSSEVAAASSQATSLARSSAEQENGSSIQDISVFYTDDIIWDSEAELITPATNNRQSVDAAIESGLTSSFEIPSVEKFLGVFKSGIGLDIAKNHTGVCLWRDGKVETLGFKVGMDYDSGSYMAEAKMRLEFKRKIEELLKGYSWEVCIIEDVYGGVNFDTTRKLLALNCVVDELILEGKIDIGNLYRFKESEWMKDLRKIHKAGNKLNPKYECELILEFLNFNLVTENKNKPAGVKQDMFYEDRCDATGQLLGLAMHLNSEEREVKKSSVRMSGIVVDFIDDLDDFLFSLDEKIAGRELLEISDFNHRNLETSLLDAIKEHPENIVYMQVSTGELGTFGMKNGFDFYEQGYGYLVGYSKQLRKSTK